MTTLLPGHQLSLLHSRPGTDVVLLRGVRQSDGARVLVRTHSAVPPDPQTRNRLRRQHDALSGTAHSRIARALTLVDEPQRVAVIMADPGGAVLDPLRLDTPSAALATADGVSAALAALHEVGWWHLDLRPEDVMMAADGPVLIGLGVAAPAQPGATDDIPPAQGPHHAGRAPECGRLKRLVDGRADQYGLGVLLYRCLAGRDPLQASAPDGLAAAQLGRRPTPVATVRHDVGPALSDVVDRLLAADPDQRYRSWAGVIRDLDACRDGLAGGGGVGVVGDADAPTEFVLPAGLVGREAQQTTMMDAWRRTLATGRPQLVLVSGESGAGKTALVSDAVDSLSASGVVCGETGFDLLGGEAPFATTIRALSQVVDRVLAEPDDRMQAVVRSLRSRLGGNESLAVRLMPPLARLLGDAQPDGTPDTAADFTAPGRERHRIDRTVVEAIAGFATSDLDLVIVLDDLQWADAPTLHLLGLLLNDHAAGPVLLVGTFRTQEVTTSHPLAVARAQWEQEGAEIVEVEVGPLDHEAVAELIARTVGLTVSDTAPLAEAVVARTGGDALFTRIYLTELARRGLIAFDATRDRWDWQLQTIAQQNLAESAPELVRDRVRRCSDAVQQLLTVIAHLDTALPLPILADLVDAPVMQARSMAEEAQAAGLLRLDRDERFRFAHDRVRQVALDALDDAERQHLHLRIGRRLRDRLHAGGQQGGDVEADLFTVVAQLNRARHLITDADERAGLLELNRLAAQQAHRRGAYAAALALHRIALELLPETEEKQPADARHGQSARVELLVLAAQTALLAGKPDLVEPWCEEALRLSADPVERGRAHLVLFHHWWQRQQPVQMLAAVRRTLAEFGDPLPDRTGLHHVMAEVVTTTRAVRGITPADLHDLPHSEDAVSNAVVRVSLATAPAGYVHEPLTMVLLGLRNTRRALRHGLSPASAYAVCTYGFVLTAILGRVDAGHAWSSAAVELGRSPHSNARGATVFMHNAFVAHWATPMADTLPALGDSYHEGIEEGDVGFPVAGLFFRDLHALMLGEPLDGLASAVAEHASVMQGFHQWSNLQRLAVVRQAVTELQTGSGSELLDGDAFNSTAWLAEHTKPTDLTLWIHSLRGFLALRHGRMEDARQAATAGRPLSRLAPGQAVIALQTFNEGLVWADAARSASGRHRARLLARAGRALVRLRRWRTHVHDNHAHRVALVEAEIAAATGRPAAAMAAYEQAATLAARNGWLADLGLTCDRAAGFHQRQGSSALAAHYARLGLAAHRSWRADGVVASFCRRWDALLPASEIDGEEHSNDRVLARVGRTLGSDMTAEELMARMLELLVDQSGATSGYLVVPDAEELRVEAAVHVDGDSVRVIPTPDRAMTAHEDLSAPIVRYVARTRQMLQINDVRSDRRQRLDPGLHTTGVRAVLCMPLTTPGGLTGVVHLANDLTAGAFDPDRIEVLRLLSVQAAIAIDNARLATGTQRLTRDLEEMRQAASRLADQALTDPLTGLPNRYWLDTRLEEALRQADGDGMAVSLLYCDLDGFKAVNDTLGHQAGDDLLIDMTRRLTAAVRPGDTVTRVGGDEFVVLLQSEAPGDGVRQVAERIIAACQRVVPVGEDSIELGVSVGAATAEPGSDTATTLLARADAAMYRAKADGKGGFVVAGSSR